MLCTHAVRITSSADAHVTLGLMPHARYATTLRCMHLFVHFASISSCGRIAPCRPPTLHQRTRVVGSMPRKERDPAHLIDQSKSDEMSDAEFAVWHTMMCRRGNTKTQHAMSSKYPIWRCLLKDKLSKLAIKRAVRNSANHAKRQRSRLVCQEFMSAISR